jgi:hypothetical protein
MVVIQGEMARAASVAEWITRSGIRTLNVAGNRESTAPGIGGSVERFLVELFRQLGHEAR